jgi:DNA-binding protein HU-beta
VSVKARTAGRSGAEEEDSGAEQVASGDEEAGSGANGAFEARRIALKPDIPAKSALLRPLSGDTVRLTCWTMVDAGERVAGSPPAHASSAMPVSFDDSYHLEGGEQVTKSEFIDQVADRAGLSKRDASDAVEAMLSTIEEALKRGSDVTFSGFGKFSVSQRSAREGRNPATGEKIQIAASKAPKFTAGASLKKAVN